MELMIQGSETNKGKENFLKKIDCREIASPDQKACDYSASLKTF